MLDYVNSLFFLASKISIRYVQCSAHAQISYFRTTPKQAASVNINTLVDANPINHIQRLCATSAVIRNYALPPNGCVRRETAAVWLLQAVTVRWQALPARLQVMDAGGKGNIT